VSPPVPTPIVVARRVAGSIFILSLVVVLIGIAFLASWYITRPVAIAAPSGTSAGSGVGGTTSTGPTSSPSPTPKPPKPTKAERERGARAELERLAAADLNATYFQGQWVAQLSSKYIGVKDKLQETATGSHTFKAVDLLDEHRGLRKRFSKRHEVRLLRGQDFYPYYKTKDGDTFWYTFVLSDFGSEKQVKRFCAAAYPKLKGKVRKNRCLPRELKA
jgi:hypothetical protein